MQNKSDRHPARPPRTPGGDYTQARTEHFRSLLQIRPERQSLVLLLRDHISAPTAAKREQARSIVRGGRAPFADLHHERGLGSCSCLYAPSLDCGEARGAHPAEIPPGGSRTEVAAKEGARGTQRVVLRRPVREMPAVAEKEAKAIARCRVRKRGALFGLDLYSQAKAIPKCWPRKRGALFVLDLLYSQTKTSRARNLRGALSAFDLHSRQPRLPCPHLERAVF